MSDDISAIARVNGLFVACEFFFVMKRSKTLAL